MLDTRSILERKIKSFEEELGEIRYDYKTNLKYMFYNYLFKPFTKVVKEEIQREIESFLERNNLNIKVCVYELIDGQELYIVGNTLIDQLIWERIAQYDEF